MVKKGDIYVRTKEGINANSPLYKRYGRIGAILIAIAERNWGVPYFQGCAVSLNNCRPATKREKEAFYRGIFHIDDIKPELYPIY